MLTFGLFATATAVVFEDIHPKALVAVSVYTVIADTQAVVLPAF